MDILLAPWGTRGDVEPLLAVGEALARRHHSITLASAPNFEDRARELGFAFYSVGEDVRSLLGRHQGRTHRTRWQVRQLVEKVVPAQFEALARLDASFDLVVSAGLQIAAASLAEKRGVPHVLVLYCPCALPSPRWPPPTLARYTLPRTINRLAWRLVESFTDFALLGPINRGRRGLGLKPVGSVFEYLFKRHPVVVASDPRLAPLPDPPAGILCSPPWIHERGEAEELPAALHSFLEKGPRVIYAGFGSMVADHPRALAGVLIEAARRTGCRLLLGQGWGGLGRGLALPPWCHLVGEVPHEGIFPYLAGVIHHGGAGTTFRAARSGIPQLLVPHLLDQFYWARRVSELKLGPPAIPLDHLTLKRLTAAMTELADNPLFRQNARTFAAHPRKNGLKIAVQLLEELGGLTPKIQFSAPF